MEIIDRAFASGWVAPMPPAVRTGRTVAVIGSGPAGLAAAQQLTRAGHAVTVFERDDAPGGLLRYGIPEFKLEKRHLDRRLDQMRAEGTEFRCGVEAGTDVSAETLRASFDAIVLSGGARVPRDLPMPGRELDGIHQAMEYLPLANRAVAPAWRRRPGGPPADPAISARGKHVVIIGGGDTGADCLGTAHRQGAASVTQLEILPRPPATRPGHQPWPTYPMIYRVSSAHEEGGERTYAVTTLEFLGDDDGPGAGAAAGRRRGVRPGARHRARAALRPGPAGHGLHRRRTARAARRPRRRLRPAGQRRPGRLVRHLGAGRVRRRGHGPRPVADRLGHRRGPQRRRCRRPVPGRPGRASRRRFRPRRVRLPELPESHARVY